MSEVAVCIGLSIVKQGYVITANMVKPSIYLAKNYMFAFLTCLVYVDIFFFYGDDN